MKALLEKAWNGDDEALAQVGEMITKMPRDEEGVFVIGDLDPNIYGGGILLYSVYMEYETKLNKKAGYADIAAQVKKLYERLTTSYDLVNSACFIKLLADTLSVASPEIYEHYRSIQDTLKEALVLFLDKEDLELEEFPKLHFIQMPKGDPASYRLVGMAILEACSGKLLQSEKYEELGRVLAALA